MNIEIGGKGYELNFGMAFIRKLDERHFVDKNGLKFGQGVTIAAVQLQDMNPTILQDVVECGLHHVKKDKPSSAAIEEAIVKEVEDKGLKKTCDDFLTTLEKQPLIADKLKDFKKRSKEQQKKLEEENQ
ncbi:hypothetical protein J18TS1_12610 [Oceanobacillus oncorhynchi subsp. incaldanensis]|uniref:tail assembly chaperone n=1 Tax=Oceanobacillus oncorhynchi TaxID=545501 RepID=UPI001B228657|nr:tail assembly chaperone [Oceanobacillus oncorhynchi]GIO18161.1 hypothetical protein J18TS1_12610 [Oceanobacillus oncorhynchi subsp. incaldanensis]